jgi:hypothetical protein
MKTKPSCLPGPTTKDTVRTLSRVEQMKLTGTTRRSSKCETIAQEQVMNPIPKPSSSVWNREVSGGRQQVKERTSWSIAGQILSSSNSGQRSHHEGSEEHASFILFDKEAPDPSYGLAFEGQVSESSGVYVSGVTHIVNCSITSRTC